MSKKLNWIKNKKKYLWLLTAISTVGFLFSLMLLKDKGGIEISSASDEEMTIIYSLLFTSLIALISYYLIATVDAFSISKAKRSKSWNFIFWLFLTVILIPFALYIIGYMGLYNVISHS